MASGIIVTIAPPKKTAGEIGAPALVVGLHRVRPGMQADHRNEHDQPDVHQQALRRHRDRAEYRVAAPRPAGEQPHDEDRARGAQTERGAAHFELDHAEHHAGADAGGRRGIPGQFSVWAAFELGPLSGYSPDAWGRLPGGRSC